MDSTRVLVRSQAKSTGTLVLLTAGPDRASMHMEERQMYEPRLRNHWLDRDPANDGIEVSIIRREMKIAAGHSLHWTDSDGRVLSHPMSTAEASEKGISV